MLTLQDWIIYLLCFVGLFTSVFFALTILSPHKMRYRRDQKFRPKVSIIIPMWNEGSANGERLRKTVESLLACDYPKSKLEIIIVNDGSTDNSLNLANQYRVHGVKVLSYRKSRGKTHAVNLGMRHATGELVAGLDADSFIMPDVLDKLVPCFKDKNVMAAVPSIKIWNPRSFLQLVQYQEFLSAVFIRHIQSELGAIPLAPGAFTLIRKSFIDAHGDLRADSMVEDLEMSMRIQSEGYLIENVTYANVYTSGVKTFRAFVSQRLRWFCGFIITVRKYNHLLHPRYGNLGVFILPVSIIYILLTMGVFFYTIAMLFYNLSRWLWEVHLVGFSFKDIFEFSFDPFLVTIDNTTILPFILFFVILSFMYYIKTVSEEKQGILMPFFAFNFSYWLIGSLCWVLAIYYYIAGKSIKWGPNYFRTRP
jgi:cellulose synthase/poly-beta-1,6-N-acetylglucosamine synthase-like glycosyltransferase